MIAPSGDWIATLISEKGFGLGLLASFGGGLLLNLTPCVYPMIPVTLAFFNRQVLTERRSVGALAAMYALGLALSYAVLGAVAAQTGAFFGSWLQSPLVSLWIAAAIVALSLSMFGVYELRVPQIILKRFDSAASGFWGAFSMGCGVGLVAAPCVGPFLVSLLLVMSKFANPLMGFTLFFALGLGMGLPSIVFALAARQLTRLPKAGEWMVWSKKFLGVILLGVALWFVRPLLPEIIMKGSAVALLIAAGAYLGWLESSKSRSGMLTKTRMGVGVALLAAAIYLIWPRTPQGPPIAWQVYTTQALAAASSSQKPAVVDIYADWCLPCVELDHSTFRHLEVIEALAAVAALRIDVTREASPAAQLLMQRHEVYGVPTVLFFDRTGVERTDLRVTGFVPPEEFLRRLRLLQLKQ